MWKRSQQYSKLNKCRKYGRQRVIRKRTSINYTYNVSKNFIVHVHIRIKV